MNDKKYTLYCNRVVGWQNQSGDEWDETVVGYDAAVARRDEILSYHGDPDTQDGQTAGTGCGVRVSIQEG